MYDIFGDIHGHTDILIRTLSKLGYSKRKGGFEHPERKAIFLGDYFGRGTEMRSTVAVVRQMVETGSAYAIVGNHEYNLVCLFEYSEGQPLRPHTFKNLSHASDTLFNYKGKESVFFEDLRWIKTLPLYLELGGIRLVHAAWVPDELDFLQRHYPNYLSDNLLKDSSLEGSKTSNAIKHLLTGVSVKLNSAFEDYEGRTRSTVRMRWWKNPIGKTMADLAARYSKRILAIPPPDEYMRSFPGYPPNAPILFLGHYCFRNTPKLLASNVVCLDYCIYKSKKLCVYRYEGEAALDPGHLFLFD